MYLYSGLPVNIGKFEFIVLVFQVLKFGVHALISLLFQ